jgi:hypothetical protein
MPQIFEIYLSKNNHHNAGYELVIINTERTIRVGELNFVMISLSTRNTQGLGFLLCLP